MDKLGKMLQTARKKKGLTQAETAKKIGWVNGNAYGQLENGCSVNNGYKRVPQRGVLVRLSKLFGADYKKLAEGAIDRVIDNKRRIYFGKNA